MLIFKEIAPLQKELQRLNAQGLSIGFIPTMGALHNGHLSLVNIAATHCNVTICSIFVNPTQFNDKDDLERYPRTPEHDIMLLQQAKCDILFMPGVEDMYANVTIPSFELGYLNQILEAAHRPGHFDGVAQVVYRFFDIIKPTKAFFGSKDYQQVMVVRRMTQLAGFSTEIIACPIIREKSGLAMSSRNSLLSEAEKAEAEKISAYLSEALNGLDTTSIEQQLEITTAQLLNIHHSRLDYLVFANPDTLEPITHWQANQPVMVLVAVFIGKIRLIDNMVKHPRG